MARRAASAGGRRAGGRVEARSARGDLRGVLMWTPGEGDDAGSGFEGGASGVGFVAWAD